MTCDEHYVLETPACKSKMEKRQMSLLIYTQDRGKKIKHFDRGFHADVPVDVEYLTIHGPPQGILGISDAEVIESVSVWTVDSVKHINSECGNRRL